MPSRRLLCVLSAAALAAGCASVPTGGAVHLGRVVPAPGGLSDLDVRVFPPSWNAHLTASAVVAGFLHAVVNDDDDYTIARTYLSSAASDRWRPDAGITTYDDSALRISATGGRVQVVAPRLGHIDVRGGYEPAPGVVSTTFAMTHGGGSWKIDRLPDGVLLAQSDAQRAFRLADVYYVNRAGSALVPDQVLLRDSQHGIATALVSALLAGPSPWLAPAVRSAVPAGTGLIGTVPVRDEDGVADVNLSAPIRAASTRDLQQLSAQLVWTLRQVAGVTAVRILADGAPLSVSGVPVRQPVSSWAAYDPAAPPAVRGLLYVRGGHLRATGSDAAAVRRSDPGDVVAAARSRDGRTLAVVARRAGADRLLVGAVGQRLATRLSAPTMTRPTFDADGRVLTVVTGDGGRALVAVDRGGVLTRIPVDDAVLRAPVSDLQLSRDGARAAVVMGGELLVGRVAGRDGSETLGGFRRITPGVHGVEGIAWSGADTVVVTADAGGGQRDLVETDVDGYAVRVLESQSVRGALVAVAAAPMLPLVVATSSGQLWVDTGEWHVLAAGGRPAYGG